MIQYESLGQPLSDEAFADSLGLAGDPIAVKLCGDVRRFLAPELKLDPEFVPVDRRFSDFGMSGADSIDELEWAVRLEKAVGVALADGELAQIRDPRSSHSPRIGDFVLDVVRQVRPKLVGRVSSNSLSSE